MVDSTTLRDEPAADLVAYYVDGLYATTAAAVRARFPNSIPVGISAIGTNAGVVGDVENGCMTPGECVQWVRARRRAGVDPTAYVNDSNWAAVRAAFTAAGEPQPHYWEAHYDGIPVLSPGTVAKQYQNSAMTGGHFDRSVVADFWPGVDNAAGNTPRGGVEPTDMLLYKNTDNQQLFIVDASGKRYVWDFESADWSAKLGAPILRTTAQLALIPDAPYFGGTQSVNDPRKHPASEAQVAALPSPPPATVDLSSVNSRIDNLLANVGALAVSVAAVKAKIDADLK